MGALARHANRRRQRAGRQAVIWQKNPRAASRLGGSARSSVGLCFQSPSLAHLTNWRVCANRNLHKPAKSAAYLTLARALLRRRLDVAGVAEGVCHAHAGTNNTRSRSCRCCRR
jgi:hypothetical protein